MKAIVYGPSATLQLADIETPVPRNDEVKVRVRAASVNPLDAHMLKINAGMRSLMSKALGTRVQRPGADIAGDVVEVGRDVTRFKVGDAVFGGSSGGAFAEYACPPESRLVAKPTDVSYEEAACINVAGCTALQGLRDTGRVEKGQSVLVIGASGGVGTFTVQIAKWLGGNVTAVCSTRNVDLMHALGVDKVLDYTAEDLLGSSEQYDVIYDLVGDKPLRQIRKLLKPKGVWVGAGVLGVDASMLRMLASMFNGPAMSLFSSRRFASIVAKPDLADLETLAKLISTGAINPVIDRRFQLDAAGEAVKYVAARRARGKVVISFDV